MAPARPDAAPIASARADSYVPSARGGRHHTRTSTRLAHHDDAASRRRGRGVGANAHRVASSDFNRGRSRPLIVSSGNFSWEISCQGIEDDARYKYEIVSGPRRAELTLRIRLEPNPADGVVVDLNR